MAGEILYDTKYLQLKKTGRWFYAHRPNVSDIVIIVPVVRCKDGDEIIMLKTKRPPLVAEGVSKFNIELPAGLVGDEVENEDIIEAAKKELLEETGYRAEKITVLTRKLSSSGGLSSECAAVVLAEITDDKIVSPPQSDGGIIIECIRVKIKDVKSWLKAQEIEGNSIGSQTLAGLYLYKISQ